MGRKRAKQKRKDYRRGGNVTLPRQGGKRPEDEIISIGGPGGGRPDPRDIGRPVQPPVGKQPMPPVTQPASTVPLSSSPPIRAKVNSSPSTSLPNNVPL